MNRLMVSLEVKQPDLSDFKGSRNRFPFPTARNSLDADGLSLGDLQPIAFLLLEVADDVKRERESSMVRVWIAPVIEISCIGDEDAPTLAQTRATVPARRTNQIATAP